MVVKMLLDFEAVGAFVAVPRHGIRTENGDDAVAAALLPVLIRTLISTGRSRRADEGVSRRFAEAGAWRVAQGPARG